MATRTGAQPAKVTRVTVDGRTYVELPDVAPGFEFGPVLDTVGDLEVGERVIVTALARDADELVVIGVLGGRPGGGLDPADLEPYATDVDLEALSASITAALAEKAPAVHNHHANAIADGILALERLPVAPSGNANATQLVRADDARLSDARTPTTHTHDDRYYTEAEVDTRVNLITAKRATVSVNSNVNPLSGTPVLDAYQTLAGDSVLLIGQTTSSQNGLWLIPAGGGAWVRHPSADSAAEVSGMTVTVERGAVRGGKTYRTSFSAHINTLGSSAMTFTDVTDAAAITSGTVALARLPVAASGVNSATQLVRADDSRLNNPAVIQYAGEIFLWPVGDAHPFALECNGQTFSSTTYPDLAARLGTNVVPDMRGRVAIHQDGTQVEFDTLLESGGAKAHALTKAQLPAGITGQFQNHAGEGGSTIWAADGVFSTSSVLSGQYRAAGAVISGAHSNINIKFDLGGSGSTFPTLPPYRVMRYMIRTVNGSAVSMGAHQHDAAAITSGRLTTDRLPSTAPLGVYSVTTLAANTAGIGDLVWATSSARVTTGRRIRLTASGAYDAAGAGTGFLLELQRSVDGGAWSVVGTNRGFMAPQDYPTTAFHASWVDTPPAGTATYRVRALAMYANGQVILAGSQFAAEDVGTP